VQLLLVASRAERCWHDVSDASVGTGVATAPPPRVRGGMSLEQRGPRQGQSQGQGMEKATKSLGLPEELLLWCHQAGLSRCSRGKTHSQRKNDQRDTDARVETPGAVCRRGA